MITEAWNPYHEWDRKHLTTNRDLKNMVESFQRDNPRVGGFDTETTGLHIKKDKPFLIQFGWIQDERKGVVYTFYPTPKSMQVFFFLAKKLKYCVAHNLKYDCHMVSNIGYEQQVQSMTNLVDNMAVARLSLEAVPEREGGDSLALKSLGANYVHPDANKSEKVIKEELKKINAQRIKVLTAALKQFPIEGELTAKGKLKFWGKGVIEDFLKDPTNDVEDLPEGVRDVWNDWLADYPEATYADVDREIMIEYGSDDIITMLEFFRQAIKVVEEREQLPVLQLEMDCILPLYRMERVGLKVDMEYLEESRQRVKAYIKQLREELYSIAGERVTVGQHVRLKQLFEEKWNITLDSADSDSMKNLIEHQTGQPQRMAQIIKALRTLEKWYSTYIKRLIENASFDGKVYTQINANGAVSGRMSSDLQQNPKDPLLAEDNSELFHPRKAFIIDKDEFEMNAYIDYSQVELRVTADYTIKVMGGDKNLCRAYIPFQCTHYKTGEVFSYETKEERSRWLETKEDGSSAWVIPETNEPWTPTDMHSETTHNALVILGYTCHEKYKHYTKQGGVFGDELDKDKFKGLRGKIGKRFNFSKTYGVGVKTAMKNLNISEEIALALMKGYEVAFPGIIAYGKAIERAHNLKGYVFNAYGMRYYMEDMRKSYKLGNHNIQGSCALALKEAIIKLDAFIIDNNLKSRLILPVHDEQIIGIVKGELQYMPNFIEIMQSVFDGWCLIPIVSEPEISTTTWANKEEVTIG